MMDDSSRAAHNANFKITKQQLVNAIECYRQRKYVEDIDYIKNDLKGIDSILEALDVSPDSGISATSLEVRN
jgi:beta-lactamase class D